MTGAVLAGGLGRRLGAPSKPATPLAGRPLIAYPLAALAAACDPVAVVCKADTDLPPLPAGVGRWEEPEAPRHPAVGIAYALERAAGPVLVAAGDMPFVTARVCRELMKAAAAAPEAPAAIAESAGRLQPVLGVYRPDALPALRTAGEASLTAVVEALGPAVVEVPEGVTRSVNTPAERASAERELTAAGGSAERR